MMRDPQTYHSPVIIIHPPSERIALCNLPTILVINLSVAVVVRHYLHRQEKLIRMPVKKTTRTRSRPNGLFKHQRWQEWIHRE